MEVDLFYYLALKKVVTNNLTINMQLLHFWPVWLVNRHVKFSSPSFYFLLLQVHSNVGFIPVINCKSHFQNGWEGIACHVVYLIPKIMKIL